MSAPWWKFQIAQNPRIPHPIPVENAQIGHTMSDGKRGGRGISDQFLSFSD